MLRFVIGLISHQFAVTAILLVGYGTKETVFKDEKPYWVSQVLVSCVSNITSHKCNNHPL